MAKFLELKDISHTYGNKKTPSLSHVSWDIKKGDIGALLGPSGCGKTTLLRLIAGFENLFEGVICIDDKCHSNFGETTPPDERKVGIVFQNFALFPHLTVGENIAFGLNNRPKEDQIQITEKLLDVFQIHSLKTKYPHEISGGEQQRVAIARALAPEPVILLLDEPFSNLDNHLRKALLPELRKIFKSLNITVILVTHIPTEAFEMADEVAIMDKGRIIQSGNPKDVNANPETQFVKDFLEL